MSALQDYDRKLPTTTLPTITHCRRPRLSARRELPMTMNFKEIANDQKFSGSAAAAGR
jgi:hypothetical protein